MAGCKLIVHADDFGLSEKVNDGIIEAHRNGVLTSTSLMATGRAFSHAVHAARSTPTLDIGVHLTLIEEAPLSRTTDSSTLVDKNGHFHSHASRFVQRYLFGKISLEEVQRELDAQIRKVVDHGIAVSHLDGHQHIHILPGIRRVVGELARKYGIPAIRYPMERLQSYMLFEKGGMSRLIQLIALNGFCALAKTTDAYRPDFFFGFFFGGKLTVENLFKILTHLPSHGTCELMCHPGFYDADSRYKHWGYGWQNELDALTNQDVKTFLQSRGVELISYADLSR